MRRNLELGIISIGHGITHWYVNGFFLVVPYITGEYRLTFAGAGLLVAYRTLLGAIFNIPAGAIVDWLGQRRLVLVLSALWSGLMYMAVGWSPNYFLLQLFVALGGIGAITWHPAAMATLVERLPQRKGFALSLHEFGANLGDALAPLAIGALLVFLNWREVLELNALPGILLAVGLWVLVADRGASGAARPEFRQYLKGAGSLFTNRPLLGLAAVASLRTMSQNILNTFLPIYLITGLKMGSDTAGFYVALLTFPALLSGLVVGTLSDRTGRKPAILLCLLSSGIVMFLLGFSQAGVLFTVSLVLLGLLLFSIRPVLFAYAMEAAPPEMGGTTIGLLFSINTTLAALAPVLAGLVADRVGLLSTFYLGGLLVLAGGLLAFLLPRKPAARVPKGMFPVKQP